jgi:preprotein translocase subunit SecG
MAFVIGILTFVMVVDSIALILLVLVQLPKKEAGAGLAFGGAATDALFGAGSGNVLTKITKYAAGIFFILCILLSVLQSVHYRRSSSAFTRALEQSSTQTPNPSASTQPPRTLPTPATAPANASNLLAVPPQVESTNAPAASTKPATAPAAASSTPSGTNK